MILKQIIWNGHDLNLFTESKPVTADNEDENEVQGFLFDKLKWALWIYLYYTAYIYPYTRLKWKSFAHYITVCETVPHCVLFTSRKSHPELQEELGELRKHLLESTNDMTPLKVWELQGGQSAVIYGPLLRCSGLGAVSPSEIKAIHMVPGENCPLDELGSSEKVAVCTPCLLQRSVLFLFRLLNRCSCSQPSSILHCETWCKVAK